jgi:hypothetical protein
MSAETVRHSAVIPRNIVAQSFERHERTETSPCIKRSPTNGPANKSGHRAEFRKAQTYRWRSKNRDRYNSYMRELMRRLRGEAAESFFRTRKGATPRLNAQPGKKHSHVIDRR